MGGVFKDVLKHFLKDHVVDYIASDAHDTTSRTPQLSKCYKYIVKNMVLNMLIGL